MSEHHWLDKRELARATIVAAYGDASGLDYLRARSPADDGREVGQ